jgi:hypothetical protein
MADAGPRHPANSLGQPSGNSLQARSVLEKASLLELPPRGVLQFDRVTVDNREVSLDLGDADFASLRNERNVQIQVTSFQSIVAHEIVKEAGCHVAGHIIVKMRWGH